VPTGLGNPPSGILSPTGGGELPAGQLAGEEETAGERPQVLGVSDESAPRGDDGEAGVLGANQGGGENGTAPETTGSSLPFTGLGLGLMAAIGLLLALGGTHLRRKAS
jgi:hypothetical protein